MPKEATIKKHFIEECKKNKWSVWFPSRTRFKKEQDIFGIGDALVSTKSGLILIQLTTVKNISARKKKIKKIVEENNLNSFIEIYGWDDRKKEFKIVPVY